MTQVSTLGKSVTCLLHVGLCTSQAEAAVLVRWHACLGRSLGAHAHQKVKDVSPCDGSCNVVPLQCTPFVLLRVVPRSERKFQDKHLACLFASTSIIAQMALSCRCHNQAVHPCTRVIAHTFANKTGASALIILTSSSDFMICKLITQSAASQSTSKRICCLNSYARPVSTFLILASGS